MPIQFRRPGRLCAGLGIEVHHRDYPGIRLGLERTRVVRIMPTVEEDQMARMRTNHRAIPVHRADVGGVPIMGKDNLSAF